MSVKVKTLVLVSAATALCTTLLVLAILRPLLVIEQDVKERAQTVSRLESDEQLRSFATAPTHFIYAARQGRDAVVSIETKIKSLHDSYFTRKVLKGNGSGVIIDSNGTIVTNYHVVKDAIHIKVVLNNRQEYIGTLVGHDEQTDIAVLKIEAHGIPYLASGNSDSIQVGEWILAIGNPFKLQSSVTAGIISAKARSINLIEDHGIEAFIQTDAAVNSGNSGGALIDTEGRLIGINTAILSSSGAYQGFSFAIPSNLVRKVVKDILQYGAVQRGWLGITVRDVNQDLADRLALTEVKGVCIESVTKNGAAQKGGMLENDVIVAINKYDIQDLPNFMEQISSFRPGDKIEITYVREGETLKKHLTLRNMLNTTELIAVRKDDILKKMGIEIRDLTRNEVLQYGKKGVYVVSILHKSPVDKTNMTPGYIITRINDTDITSSTELIQILKSTESPYRLDGIYKQYSGNYPYTVKLNE